MTRKQKRLAIIGGGMSFIVAAVLLVMFAFGQSIAYFYMPADLEKTPVNPGTRIRLGGLVAEGSVKRGEGRTVSFTLTDGEANVPVSYTGILPDLFREGQGVVTEGVFDAATHGFVADSVLAKHDENYMPKEVADRLKDKGLWQNTGEGGQPSGAAPSPAGASADKTGAIK
ncbi:cytochrome c maturation protein CcmE [Agrobacterium tumefaciens]|uniref:Cytochrome c-type biogenesis protein CcmE n=1 Tax=Agrobacterium tumefaciens TaxID=358 RepID=A0AA44J7G4_AGRTU|nr:cytochrome c maturation protein CcmE [Agrobacterium tumefaciens]NSL22575.1 cytochrome c maturation protein CcmE [Agrobacterium tumefaciens]NTB84392.1 cytochrome c maturation protein CcmE [Agrobacterium tumefaciens]NTC17989.1 cytochrome c maturation protein CcmE [Agrobacterium tumefaciens]NTC27116.1 cytochrome c maturation protein CcmE [Agrobacterium tumefaciens]NTC57038.1 cytochrome c maturation protein CcmE [Agrobacterium tumefaciens]